METTNSKTSIAFSDSRRPSNRLLFDRRYGWVFDEWKDPSEEALAGGRGMFCILPLAKNLMNTAAHSINLAANFAVEIFERPHLFSHQAMQANLDKQLKKFICTLKQPEMNCSAVKGKHLKLETSE